MLHSLPSPTAWCAKKTRYKTARAGTRYERPAGADATRLHSNIQIGAMSLRAAPDGPAAEAAADCQDAAMDGALAPRSPPRVTLGVHERGGPISPDKNPAKAKASRARVDDGAEAVDVHDAA